MSGFFLKTNQIFIIVKLKVIQLLQAAIFSFKLTSSILMIGNFIFVWSMEIVNNIDFYQSC